MNPWPADDVASTTLLRTLVTHIDRRSRRDGELLLYSLLAFAWPSEGAQDQ